MQRINSAFKRSLNMMDSEKKELRKVITKKNLIWIIGVAAIAALVAIIIIFSFLGGGSS